MRKLSIITLAASFAFLVISTVGKSARAYSMDDLNRLVALEKMAHRKNPVSNTPEAIQRGKDK